MELIILTDEQRHALCDMGYFNTVIYGYLIEAMKNADFTREQTVAAIRGLREALDVTTAAEAEEAYRNF